MNDVLATVGVCIGVNVDGSRASVKDRSKVPVDKGNIDDVSTENSVGLIIDSIDLGFISLTRLALMGIRHRLQVSVLVHVDM